MNSYPFDWIFSNLDMIIDCIEDKFEKFLNRSLYIDINSDNGCGHSIYHKTLFFHKNPLVKNEDYSYYERCVDRFKILLDCDKNKLFVMIFINNKDIDYEYEKKIIDFNNNFSKYTTNYRLLVIFHINDGVQKHIFKKIDNIDFLELHTLAPSNGAKFKFKLKSDNNYLNNILISMYNFNV